MKFSTLHRTLKKAIDNQAAGCDGAPVMNANVSKGDKVRIIERQPINGRPVEYRPGVWEVIGKPTGQGNLLLKNELGERAKVRRINDPMWYVPA